ncbi:MAG TPA: hypothetical protein VI039_03795 [Solirubrobacterales bacterium]
MSKIGFVLAVLMGALAVPLTTASATDLTAPSGSVYTGTLKASNSSNLTLHAVADLTCKSSTIEAQVEQHGVGVPAKGYVSSLSLAECNHHVVVYKYGSLEIHTTSNGNGTVTWSGGTFTALFTTIFGSVHCTFETNNTDVGALTAASSDGSHATWDIGSSPIPIDEASSNFLCGSSAEWTGNYKFTSPTGLRVDSGDPFRGITAPAGSAYTGTLKAENSGNLVLHGPLALTCKASTFEASLESHGAGVTAKGTVGSLTFGECNHDVQVVTKGTIEVHPNGGGNGTVTSSGVRITVIFTSFFGDIHCVFATNNTQVGTLTGASSESGHAVLETEASPIPIDPSESDFACGSSAELTGNYKLTSPTGLLIDSGG